MAVVTISRQYGIGGIELSQKLAHQLDYHLYATEIAMRVANKMGLDHQVVQEYQTEMAHKSKWLISAYAGRLALFESHYIDEKKYNQAVTEVITDIAHADNAIILGWGAQCILCDLTNTFHFRIVANMETRLAHILTHYRNPEDIPPRKMLEHRIQYMDKARRKYIRTHFKANIDNPSLYHAIFHLSLLGRNQLVDLISEIVQGKKE